MRKLPPLNSLRAFEAAARHGSFKRAAAELCVTPTAVSHQIAALEAACGKRLFRRRPRPLALTPAGRRLFPVLRNGLDAFALAFDSLSRDDSPRTLRLTTTDAFAGHWLVPRLPRWQQAHGDVPLEVIGTNDVVDLRAGEADVAVRYCPAMPSGYAGVELFRDTYFPVCRPELLPDGRPFERIGELLRHTLIHFDWARSGPDVPTLFRWLAMARAVDPSLPGDKDLRFMRFRQETHAIEAVAAGQGIALCSSIHVRNELESGALARAHDLALPGFGFYLVHVPGHSAESLIDELAAWLVEPYSAADI
ncbi:MAG: LysR substrate-binding domain-containing protein [Ectothiorhodospiraceae bacterium]